MTKPGPSRVRRLHGIRTGTPRPSPSFRSCRAYHCASRRLNRDSNVIGLISTYASRGGLSVAQLEDDAVDAPGLPALRIDDLLVEHVRDEVQVHVNLLR